MHQSSNLVQCSSLQCYIHDNVVPIFNKKNTHENDQIETLMKNPLERNRLIMKLHTKT